MPSPRSSSLFARPAVRRGCSWRSRSAAFRLLVGFGSVWVAGYLAGGAMHLALDIGFNGRLTPRNIFAFYSFGFRWAHGFDALTLFGSEPRVAPAGFWGSFFLGPRLARPRVGHRAAVPYAPQG